MPQFVHRNAAVANEKNVIYHYYYIYPGKSLLVVYRSEQALILGLLPKESRFFL